jgi:gliding motility-associated-like protein
MKRIIFVFYATFLILYCADLEAQVYDAVGSGRAIQFDGVDDYINLGNRFDDLLLPVTISVWVNVSPNMNYAFPIFNSQDNLPLYNGITFAVSPTAFSIQYGDGRGENNPVFRRGKSASLPEISGRWVNLTAIMRSASDMDLFLNGVNIGGQYSGDSDQPMSSMSPNDDAKIGAWYSNGITTRYKGVMDELRIYNRSLTQVEIREQMCKKLSGNEAGLIGYWTFDETSGNVVKDKSVNKFDGVINGSPTRVFSGAPLGDESIFLYSANWTNKSLLLDEIEVGNMQGNPSGLHIYKVKDTPSQTNGLDAAQANKPYYGVFLASLDIGKSFDLKINETLASCNVFNRNDNSQPLWTELVSFSSLVDRQEVMPAIGEEEQNLDLGADRILCDQAGYTLTSNVNTLNKAVLWSTGETTSSIDIHQSGVYFLQIASSCAIQRDTVAITFLEKPPLFTLGGDEPLCILKAQILKPYVDSQNIEFKWQDGSKAETFTVKNVGLYWVTAKNVCGAASDTLRITTPSPEQEVGNIDLGDDRVLCHRTAYTLTSNINTLNKTVLWSTGETTSSIDIQQTGIYSLQVSSSCAIERDTISVKFLENPPSFSLGADDSLCFFKPTVLKPYIDSPEVEFEWQDGSKANTFTMQDFGLYWVTIKNFCGVEKDTLRISRRHISLSDFPNIITPNGDPLNQFFIIDPELTGPHRFLVYNRWGEKVFATSDYKNDWDGAGLSSGTYYYQLEGECVGKKKGTVTISR